MQGSVQPVLRRAFIEAKASLDATFIFNNIFTAAMTVHRPIFRRAVWRCSELFQPSARCR